MFDMREIKFRAWDKNTNTMTPDATIQELIARAVDRGRNVVNWEALELMQYTTLKDKNGKEIYEGDIVKMSGVHSIVKYGEQNVGHDFQGVGFYTQEIGKEWDVFNIFGGRYIEVIGNIYENPELLK